MPVREKIIFDTPFDDLVRQFNVRASLKRVSIPQKLYDVFLKLYRRSCAMQEKLETIIEDGEHRLILAEGSGGFVLPDEDFLSDEVENLGRLLHEFNPFLMTKSRSGQISLERGQIQGFFNVFTKDTDIVEGALDVLRNTEYLKYHRYLRDVQKVKYAGPSSLQEIVNVFVSLKEAQYRQIAYLKDLKTNRDYKI